MEYLHHRLHQETDFAEHYHHGNDDFFTVLIDEQEDPIISLTSQEDAMAATTQAKTVKVEIRYIPDKNLAETWAKANLGLAEGFMDQKDMDLVDMPGFKFHRRAANHPRNLETIYKNYQQIDGEASERVVQLKRRSMSVGDAIVIDDVAYYVAPSGFVTRGKDGSLVPVEAE